VADTRFVYAYRDASNYKRIGSVVFQGPPFAGLIARLKKAFDGEEFFVAQQVGIPSVAFFDKGEYPVNEDDHCFHQFIEAEATHDAPTDTRTFLQFVQAVEKAAMDGWRVFDPGKGERL
jgi:hypothetical protein